MPDPARTRMDSLRLVRPELLELLGYEPIEPVDVLAEELGIPADQIVKLDGNENPYGPSPRVKEALADFDLYHLYPDPEQRRVRRALADYLGLDSEHIVVGNGSDELLELIACLFLSPGDAAVNCVPTFGMYPFVSQIRGARVVEVPRREDFGLDVAGVQEAAEKGAKVIFLASPNNPSGNVMSAAELEAVLATGALVVVDEAYVEFSDRSFVGLVPQRDNLIVLRTFSKWAGLPQRHRRAYAQGQDALQHERGRSGGCPGLAGGPGDATGAGAGHCAGARAAVRRNVVCSLPARVSVEG
jgi:histidinol-phosphate aminotransferase